MTSYSENTALINGLWQTFTPSEELRDLFRDTFGHLDQEIFCEAVKQVRQDTDTVWPSVRTLLKTYRTIAAERRKQAAGPPASRHDRAVVPAVDSDREKALVEEYHRLIDGVADEDFHRLEDDILDRYDAHAISSATAHRLLRRLRAKVFGDGPGLSEVTGGGVLTPLSLEGFLVEKPRRTTKHEPQRNESENVDRRPETRVEVRPRPPGEKPDWLLLSPDRPQVRVERPERGGGPLPGPAHQGVADVGARQTKHDHPDRRVAGGGR